MTNPTDHSHSPWRSARRTIWLLWRTWEWPVVGFLAVTGLVLGYIGFSIHFGRAPIWNLHPWEILYRTLQLLALNFTWFDKPLHWTLQFARLILPALAVYASIRALAALYYGQVRILFVQFFARDHIVICGLGRKGLQLTRRLRERGDRVVVIEQNAENTLIGAARNVGAAVLIGDATEPYMLRQAAVCRARHVVAVSRDDGLNAEVCIRALELAHGCNRILRCACHVFSSRLRQLLDRHQQEAGAWDREQLKFFNIYEDGAEVLLNLDPPFDAGPAAAPHILVLGVGRMGEALLVKLAELWKLKRGDGAAKLRVTMGDRSAPEKRDFLLSEYPQLAGVWDLDPVGIEVKSPAFQAGSPLYEHERYLSLTRAYVCFDDDSLGLTAALTVDDRLKAKGRQVPIVLRTSTHGGLAALLPGIGEPVCKPECVKAFPLLQHTCTPELVLGRR
ncbi:MAG: NAD-binding protein [candidate division WOR-3 bacterium]|nr:NAD-binding protein [candidate division WOR-3 bacterium]